MDSRPWHIVPLLALAFLTACDNTIDPVVDDGTHAFAITGYLDMGADTQFVRIAALRQPEPSASTPVPRSVVTTRLSTHEIVVWQEASASAGDVSSAGGIPSTGEAASRRDHVFFAPFRPAAGASYVIEIRDSGTGALKGFTSVPDAPAIEIDAPRVFGGDVSQRLAFDGIAEPARVRAAYNLHVGSPQRGARVEVDYDARFYSSAGNRVEIFVPYDLDFERVRQEVMDRFGGPPIILERMELTVRALSREWLSPATATNIENGEGFFASVGEFTASWSIADSTAERIGFDAGP
ncbi:MAG: hypothetical protein WD021_10705 [Rhodothermales bacterium]